MGTVRRPAPGPISCAFLLLLLAQVGCKSPADYKEEADRDVYAVIESSWNAHLDAAPGDYQVTDQPAEPNEWSIAQVVGTENQLTLEACAALATRYNRDYQQQKEALYLQGLDFTQVRHWYEWNFIGALQGGYVQLEDDEAVGASGALGAERLWASGARVTSQVGLAWIDILSGNLRQGLATIFDVSLKQPLLRGSDPDIVLEPLTQAQRDTLYQIRSFQRFRQTFSVAVASEYYRVLQRQQELEFAQLNAQTLTQACDRLAKLSVAGRLPQFELDQAHQDRLEAQDILLQAQRDYQEALDQLKLTMNVPPQRDFQLSRADLRALQQTLAQQPEISAAQAVTTALEERLDLRNRKDEVADAERQVLVARDRLQAELNLLGEANLTSNQRTELATLKELDDEYLAGLELDLPLDRLAERNVYRKSLINRTQRQRLYDQASDQVAVEVRQAHRNFTEALDRYRVQEEGHALAQTRYANTLTLLQYARTNTRDVLDAQEDLFAAQNALIDAQMDYVIAMLEFCRDTGILDVTEVASSETLSLTTLSHK